MRPPAFQFYADDFLAGVADMSQSEVGAYILLLCHQWNRGSAPVQPERQQLLAKGPVSEHVLAKFKMQDDGTLKNVRLEIEREKQAIFRGKQQEKGRLSGQARREPRFNHGSTAAQPGHEPDANRKATGGQPETNPPSPSPVSINTPIAPKGAPQEVLPMDLPPPSTTPPPAPEPKDALQLRAEAIFHRRPETPLTSGEARAFKKSKPAIEATTEADWLLLEAFYAAPQSETFTRTDLATLVNNWNGEIDRARAWQAKGGNRQEQQITLISA